MKKFGWIALCAMLLLPLGGMAQEAEPAAPITNGQVASKWAKGTVQSSETLDLFAPVGGRLEPFDLTVGDDIEADQLLLSLRPSELLAPYDGVIRIQHARIGDTASDVIGQYGALCYLERQDVFRVRTNTSTAHNKAENRDIRVGETLRLYNGNSNDSKETTGRVVSIDGTDFVVEFPADVFDPEDEVRLYRGTGSDYKDKDLVGKGKAERVPPIPIVAEGVIADIQAEDERAVSRGDVLYVLDQPGTQYQTAAPTEVASPVGGTLSALMVQPGQQVAKDQWLLSIDPLTPLECVVEADELDILSLSVGQSVRVKVDAKPEELLPGTVERIAPQGKTVLDTTKYEVTILLASTPEELLPGMHVTAYWD